MEFSERLKELRKKKGITQEELANSIYVSRSVIAKYESGVALPTNENIQKLASFFDVELSYFSDGDSQIELVSKDEHKRNLVFKIISIFGIIINSIYLIICGLPIFSKTNYTCTSTLGEICNFTNKYLSSFELANCVRVDEYNSIISGTLNNHSSMGIITLIFCVVDLFLFVLYLIRMKNKKSSLLLESAAIFLLITNIVLIVISISLV
ncbi:MAG: helix-turn-helix transcriptional regulator [Erysipelotrichales bacterium]|nr:helix-turn-helix transcriptional regulator [Erysipelotrichales bacterium]